MRSLSGSPSAQYLVALAAIEVVNAQDPAIVVVRGESVPLALAHGRLAILWVEHLDQAASEALRLAAAAHHLRRWVVRRTSYPEGRKGYLQWRKDQKVRHAIDVGVILESSGFDAAFVERVQVLVRREQLATDAETKMLEDAACLVFIETQLEAIAERLDRDHLLEVIRKTARKMTSAGLAATVLLPVGEIERELLAAALCPSSD